MKVIGWITVTVGGIILSSIWRGYVLSILWGWFVSPVFHIAQISIALAIGLSLVIGMFTYQSSSSESKDKKESAGEAVLKALAVAFLSPLFVLALGAIIHAFV